MPKTREEYRAILDEMGYEWDSDATTPDGFWVRINPSTIKYINVQWEMDRFKPARFGEAPAIRTENSWTSGKYKYRLGPGQDQRSTNIDCIVDYADEKGRKHWKNYVTVKDASGRVVREGPAPFGSKKERLEYEKLTGMRHRDKGGGKYDYDTTPRLRPKEAKS